MSKKKQSKATATASINNTASATSSSSSSVKADIIASAVDNIHTLSIKNKSTVSSASSSPIPPLPTSSSAISIVKSLINPPSSNPDTHDDTPIAPAESSTYTSQCVDVITKLTYSSLVIYTFSLFEVPVFLVLSLYSIHTC